MFKDKKLDPVHRERFYREIREVYKSSRLGESGEFIQHGKTSVLAHSLSVAYDSYVFAVKHHIKVSERELIRGAILHDYFLYDWHEKDKNHKLHGFHHPKRALLNAKRDLGVTKREADIISKHMFPLTPYPPRYKESIIVCLMDKKCSTLETVEGFQLRIEAYRKRKRARAQAREAYGARCEKMREKALLSRFGILAKKH